MRWGALVTLRLSGLPKTPRDPVSVQVESGSSYPSRGLVERGLLFRLSPGKHTLVVRCRDRADETIEVDLAPGEELVVERRLQAPIARVPGVVVDEAGHAVAGATLTSGGVTATSNADGTFLLAVSPGPTTVHARAAGRVPTNLAANGAAAPPPLRVVLVRAAVLEVRVASGREEIVQVSGSLASTPALDDVEDGDWAVMTSADLWMATRSQGPDGLARIELPPGEYRVGLAGGPKPQVVSARGGEVTRVELTR